MAETRAVVDEATVDEWARIAARAAASKTDADTVVLEVGPVLAVTSWFVITSASNTRQVKAVAQEVQRVLSESGGPKAVNVEGMDTLQWVLVNYGDIVVHVFLDEARTFYDLERLWRDVPRMAWQDDA